MQNALDASGLGSILSFEVLRVLRIWIPLTLFPLSPAELDGARKRVDSEPPRRDGEPACGEFVELVPFGQVKNRPLISAYFTLMIESIFLHTSCWISVQ